MGEGRGRMPGSVALITSDPDPGGPRSDPGSGKVYVAFIGSSTDAPVEVIIYP
jgi:hypothetical protein